ncbi:MAG: MarR family transcriptional regulator [Firmicutes bacterium]|nr:MarR family transcriptional regulator [Bacillota bacterium]
MEAGKREIAQRLMESFIRFTKLNRPQGPIAGLTPGEAHVLFCIGRAGGPEAPGIRVSEISDSLKVTSPTITQFIKGLEERGFVERTADKEDRRAVRIKLTEKGAQAIEEAHKALLASFEGLVTHLGEEKSNLLAELMVEVVSYLREKKKTGLHG